MQNQLFQLKFTAKQLNRASKKAEKAERAEKVKLRRAIEKGNMEGARIYGQNAIRQKNQAMNCLRLASRIDAVSSRLESAVAMRRVTKSIQGITGTLGKTLESMNLEKISETMDLFEKQFEDLDIRSEYVEGAMSSSTTLSTPQDEVDSLIQEVADDAGLQVATSLPSAGGNSLEPASADDITSRLEELKRR